MSRQVARLRPICIKATVVMAAVKDADAVAQRAVEPGAMLKMPVQDMFWGDRYGLIEDPFGHLWSVATPQRPPMTANELAAACDAFGKAGGGS
jgi:PhnB protein